MITICYNIRCSIVVLRHRFSSKIKPIQAAPSGGGWHLDRSTSGVPGLRWRLGGMPCSSPLRVEGVEREGRYDEHGELVDVVRDGCRHHDQHHHREGAVPPRPRFHHRRRERLPGASQEGDVEVDGGRDLLSSRRDHGFSSRAGLRWQFRDCHRYYCHGSCRNAGSARSAQASRTHRSASLRVFVGGRISHASRYVTVESGGITVSDNEFHLECACGLAHPTTASELKRFRPGFSLEDPAVSFFIPKKMSDLFALRNLPF